jgi:hypothetical protein
MSLGTAWAQAVECTKRHDGCSQAEVGFGTEPADFLDIQIRTYGMPADGLVGGSGDDLGTSEATLGMQIELEQGIGLGEAHEATLGMGPELERGIGLGEAHEATLGMGPELERGIVLGKGPDTDLEGKIDTVPE